MILAICTSQKQINDQLTNFLKPFVEKMELHTTYYLRENINELLNNRNDYDVIFLDYELLASNIKQLEKIRVEYPNVSLFFLLNTPQVHFKVFDSPPFYFVMKPLEKDSLYEAFSNYLLSRHTGSYLIVKSDEGTHCVKYDDIFYAEAFGKQTLIRTTSRDFVYKNTLLELEKQLPGRLFFRSHRSYLVNLRHVVSFNKDYVTLTNREQAKMSLANFADFESTFLKYIALNNNIGQ